MKLLKIIKAYIRHVIHTFVKYSYIIRYIKKIYFLFKSFFQNYILSIIGIPYNFYKLLKLFFITIYRKIYEFPIRLFGNGLIIQRLNISNYFRDVSENFYNKKIPSSEKYSFTVHNPYIVFSEALSYKKLFLVGDNWLDNKSDKPIALLIGFNNWKYGFIADYLKEYRVVFTPRKISKWGKYFLLRALTPSPNVLITWGYQEDSILENYLGKHKAALYRMEDGFIRSALLGATHATPYSLILDKEGLYYYVDKPSDIENILNNYDFIKNSTLLQNASKSLELILNMKLSKYNTPSIKTYESLGIKTKKRVVILGQVDNDASLKYGNPDNWSFVELIKLARYENPHAEVLYRPHPEVYKGYQKSKFKQKQIEFFAKVVSPEEPLLDFLQTVDHVYVINSLSGLESLVRGIKVTTVGAAFYGGWGLTDDRYTFERRNRTLSLIELFASIYLLYPKYLADLDDSYIGLSATAYKIKADTKIESYNTYKNISNDDGISELLVGEYWSSVLLNKKRKLTIREEKEMISSRNFKKYFFGHDSKLFQLVLLYFVSGKLDNDKTRDYFIRNVREYIDIDILNTFLLDLMEYYPGEYVYKHFSWLFKENKEFDVANTIIDKQINKINITKDKEQTLKLCMDRDDESNKSLSFCLNNEINEEVSIFETLDIDNLREALENYKTSLEYDSFMDVAKILFISNNANTMLFTRIAEMASLKMDSESSVLIAKLLQKMNIYAHNNVPIHLELENFDFSNDKFDYISNVFALQLSLTPNRINRSWARLKSYFISDQYYSIFKGIANLYSNDDIHNVVLNLELNKPDKSLAILEKIIEQGDKSNKVHVEYSKVLFTLGQHKKAEHIIKSSIEHMPTHANYTEYLRQLKAKGEFERALEVSKKGLKDKIKLTFDGHIMPIYFGLGEIEEGFKCFHDTIFKDKLIHAFGKHKYRNSYELSDINNVLFIFNSGPAEEMRFSSLYQELSDTIGCENFKLTCDYRLEKMLSRSFPSINFVPVKRTRFFSPDYPLEYYNLLPSSELCNTLDNSALIEVENSEKIQLVSELFFHFRKKYDDFTHKNTHLKVDVTKVEYFKKKLPTNTILVGLSWRSSLTNAMRNIYYLSVDDLAPLFEMENITFVNLQYDECQHELNIIRRKYKTNIIDFPELDQMNDFDGVGGLMKNLDLVISPFTAVIELAGSIGVNGILFSNHGESNWRRTDKFGTDVWYDNIKVIGSGDIGNKKIIVDDIKSELLKLVKH